jgi:hypothetical protein
MAFLHAVCAHGSKGSKANIEDFAQAFCNQYDSHEPNAKMLKYLADPK